MLQITANKQEGAMTEISESTLFRAKRKQQAENIERGEELVFKPVGEILLRTTRKYDRIKEKLIQSGKMIPP